MSTQDNSLQPINLDVDFSQVDTSYPVIGEGLKRVRIKEIGAKENKDKTGRNLVVVVETVNAETSLKGAAEGKVDDIKPGLKLTAYHPLQAKADATDKELWKKNIAQLIEAVYGDKSRSLDSSDMVGRELIARVGVGSFDGEQKNEIKAWKQAD